MKKLSTVLLLALTLTCMTTAQKALADEYVAEPKATADEAAPSGGDTGSYTVKEGDTLWTISGTHLNDPLLWPKVWKENPGIKDPDRIYPGEKINFPGAGAKTTAPAKAPEKESPDEPFVRSGSTVNKLLGVKREVTILGGGETTKYPIAQEATIIGAGFILDDCIPVMKIVGSPIEDLHVFSAPNEVYLRPSDQPKKGDRLAVIRFGDRVYHPAKLLSSVGRLVEVIGTLRVTDMRDGYTVATVESSTRELYMDDPVTPMPDIPLVYDPVPKDPALKGARGYVLTSKLDATVSTTSDIVYLDLGSKDGVKPGDSFVVKRPGETNWGPNEKGTHYIVKRYDLPDVDVGEVQVISVQPTSSTASIIRFSEPILKGYMVFYKD